MAFTDIIIVAAGSGSRFGGPLPKQFCPLGNRPVLMHTIDAFRKHLPYSNIILVLSTDGYEIWKDLCLEYNFSTPGIVIGGDSRFESVRNAASALFSQSQYVMVHDGARPFPPIKLLNNFEKEFSADIYGIIPVVAVTDSLRKIKDDGSVSVNRNSYRAVQTPQIFRTDKFQEAYELADGCSLDGCSLNDFTDDASVVALLGEDHIKLTDGSARNIKITNPGDMALAEFYLSHPE